MKKLLAPPYRLDLVWTVLPFALVAIGFGVLPLKSWDYWYHIAFGRMIASTGAMPVANHFLYTMPADAPSFVQPWLSQWFLFWMHDTLGLHGVLVFRNLLAATAFGGLGIWARLRSRSAQTGAILALVAAAFGFFTITVRTHLTAWPIFLLLLLLAFSVRNERKSAKWLIIFPLATVLWANLHGSFLYAVALCGTFAGTDFVDQVFRRTRKGPTWWIWGLVGAATLGATFLTPRGAEVYVYMASVSGNEEIRRTVTEWWPTLPWSPSGFGALFWASFIFALGLMWLHRSKLDLADFFMLLWVGLAVIPQVRFLLWYALVFPVVVSPYLSSPEKKDSPPRTAQLAHVGLAAALVFVGLAIQPWSGSNPIAAQLQAAPTRVDEPLLGLVSADTPIPAAEAIKSLGVAPRIFHDYRFGGFLVFWIQKAEPQQMVFVDSRIELPSPELWRKYYATENAEDWENTLDTYEVNSVVLAPHSTLPLAKALDGASSWRRGNVDGLWLRAP